MQFVRHSDRQFFFFASKKSYTKKGMNNFSWVIALFICSAEKYIYSLSINGMMANFFIQFNVVKSDA